MAETPSGRLSRGSRPTRIVSEPPAAIDEATFSAFRELDARVVSVGSILFILADVFYFASWFFAFFYLRSQNTNGRWLPNGIHHPDTRFGAVVVALIAVSAIICWAGSLGPLRALGARALLGGLALVLGLAGVVLGVYQLWHLGFGMTDGGYASVYVGLWGSVVVQVAGAMFWLLSVLLQSGAGGDTQLRPASGRAFARILAFIAAMAAISFVVLYFIK